MTDAPNNPDDCRDVIRTYTIEHKWQTIHGACTYSSAANDWVRFEIFQGTPAQAIKGLRYWLKAKGLPWELEVKCPESGCP